MPLYFTSVSADSGLIRAMTGPKGMIFSSPFIADSLEPLVKRQQKNKETDPRPYFDAIITELSESSIFAEERDHFSILCNSLFSKVAYYWNILCRWAYSTTRFHFSPNKPCKVKLIHKEIVRYALFHARFFLAAGPILEGAWAAKSPYESNENLYIHGFLMDETLAEKSPQELGALVDATVADICGFHPGNLTSGKNITPVNMARAGWQARMHYLAIAAPKLTFLLAANLLKVKGKALASSNSRPSSVGSVPAILTPGVHIDPAGFSFCKTSLTSLEIESQTEVEKTLRELLWLSLTQTAEIYCLTNNGNTEKSILNQYSMLWDFYCPGYINENTRMLMIEIERDILIKNAISIQKNSSLEIIAKCGVKSFNQIIKFIEETEGLDIKDIASASGINYMQV